MSDAPRYKTLRDYLRVLRQRRWLILLFTAVFGVGSYLIWDSQTPVYRAEASIACQDPLLDENSLGGDRAARRPADFEAALCATAVTGRAVASRVREELGGDASLRSVQSAVSTQREATTNFVVISAESSSPQFATELANTFARATVEVRTREARQRLDQAVRTLRNRFERQRTARVVPIVRATFEERLARVESLRRFTEPVTVTEPAVRPSDPVSPNVIRDTILGALLGLTLGIVAAFIRDSLDRRLRGVHQIQSELSLPLLASISEGALGKAAPFTADAKKLDRSDLEALRILRRNLDFAAGKTLRSVAITSGAPEEGKSTVAAGLAWAYVVTGRRTLLIDCDLRRSNLAERLGVPPSPGLTDYLAERASIPEILHTVPLESSAANGAGANGSADGEAPGLSFIPAGSSPAGPTEILGSTEFQDFLAVVGRSYDRLVLDTSPVLPVADTLEVLGLVEGIVVCVRASRTTRDQAAASRAILSHFPDKALGMVVTGAESSEYPVYGYYASAKS